MPSTVELTRSKSLTGTLKAGRDNSRKRKSRPFPGCGVGGGRADAAALAAPPLPTAAEFTAADMGIRRQDGRGTATHRPRLGDRAGSLPRHDGSTPLETLLR